MGIGDWSPGRRHIDPKGIGKEKAQKVQTRQKHPERPARKVYRNKRFCMDDFQKLYPYLFSRKGPVNIG